MTSHIPSTKRKRYLELKGVSNLDPEELTEYQELMNWCYSCQDNLNHCKHSNKEETSNDYTGQCYDCDNEGSVYSDHEREVMICKECWNKKFSISNTIRKEKVYNEQGQEMSSEFSKLLKAKTNTKRNDTDIYIKDNKLIISNTKRQCELIGDKNRFGDTKEYSCTMLPVRHMDKPIGEWMCTTCAMNLLRSRGVKL